MEKYLSIKKTTHVLMLVLGILIGMGSGYWLAIQQLHTMQAQLKAIDVSLSKLTRVNNKLEIQTEQTSLSHSAVEPNDAKVMLTASQLQEHIKRAVVEALTENVDNSQPPPAESNTVEFQLRTDAILARLESDPNAITISELDEIASTFPPEMSAKITQKVREMLQSGRLNRQYFSGEGG